jgi:hypothetical protein
MTGLIQLLSSIQNHFENLNIVILSSGDFDILVRNLEIVFEKDTLIRDKIRILKLNKTVYFVQEKSPKEEILLRRFKTEKIAKDFVMDRLHIYDKMWDGCGCKIDYYK